MKKSNLSVLLILLIGILTFVSCSSGDDSPNNNNNSSGGGDEIISCLWENGGNKICGKIYGLHLEGDKCGDDGKKIESCPNNPNKTCFMIKNINGVEYDMDLFVYFSSSYSCENWANQMGARPR